MATEHIIVNGEAMELLEDGHFPLYFHYPYGCTMFDASCCPPRLVPVDADPEEMGRTLMRLVPQAPYFVYLSAGPEDRIEARKIVDSRTNDTAPTIELVHTFVNTASSPTAVAAGASSAAVAYPNDNVYNVLPSLLQVFPAQRHGLIDRRIDFLARMTTISRNDHHLMQIKEQLERHDLRYLSRYIIAHGLEPNTTAAELGLYFEHGHYQVIIHSNTLTFGPSTNNGNRPCRSVGFIEIHDAFEVHKLLAMRYFQFQNDYMSVVGSDRRPSTETHQMEELPNTVGPAPIRAPATTTEQRQRHHNHNGNQNINDRHTNDRHYNGNNHFNNPRGGMNGPSGNFNPRGQARGGPMHGGSNNNNGGGYNDRHTPFNNSVGGPNRSMANNAHTNGSFRDTRESRAEPMMNSVSSQNNTPTNALNLPLPRSAIQHHGPTSQPSFHNGSANPNATVYCIGHISEEITESSVQDEVFIPCHKAFEDISKLLLEYGQVYLFVIYHKSAMLFGLARVTSKHGNTHSLKVKWMAPHRNIHAMHIKAYVDDLGIGEFHAQNWHDGLKVAQSVDGAIPKGNFDACRRLHDYLEASPMRPMDSPSSSPIYGNRGAPQRVL